ncbi:hypothetical protein [Nonomuraea pusilla]|uniref:Uncharacterized protein n=1 Tax=Nonomuraea pusilla TaxID=46177 RepID=A0A1H7S4E8_9ACTN|nr:hypothetical protein [Nonomuraea pusilla]SEL67541.1 hypothetical protein SAMN05660976_03049 [Nonomuraea pusilla]
MYAPRTTRAGPAARTLAAPAGALVRTTRSKEYAHARHDHPPSDREAAAGLAAGTASAEAGGRRDHPRLPRPHEYCQKHGYLGSVATNPRCVGHRGELVGIDMNDACAWHYPDGPHRANFHRADDAFSWYCY